MNPLNYNFVAKLSARRDSTAAATEFSVHKQPADGGKPKVSIILLDWCCRERLHALEWLQRQNVPRDQYEVIWIELYHRVVPEAMQHADVVVTLGQRGMYHKHIGYNVGLLLARGDIVTICDSDAVFPEDFVHSIVTSFHDANTGQDRSHVLMHHELRTSLTYPAILNSAKELKDGRWNWWDITPNVGACMSVLRHDAVRFGGFDECSSYRGYMCGPYDLGWRLVNAGIPESWHDLATVIWHFAHPDPVGTNGIVPSFRRLLENTYPHVDLHALTAVEHFSTGRLLPRRENPQIHAIRMARRQIGTNFERKYANLTGPRGFGSVTLILLRVLLLADLLAIAARSSYSAALRPIKALANRVVGRSLVQSLTRWSKFWNTKEPILLEEHEHFNIVWFRRKYYGLPKSLGAVNLFDESQLSQPAICKSRLRSLVRQRVRIRLRNSEIALRKMDEPDRLPADLEFVVDHPKPNVKVSVILLDWNVRESFHSLHYLNRQTVDRSRYELIWIEFYRNKPRALLDAVEAAEKTGRPIVDKLVVLNYPRDVIYHKHRMYNLGIILAEGEICIICDSDAMFKPSFIQTIITAFENDPKSVVHLDEVRNVSQQFYPFNFPTFEEFLSGSLRNWTGRTTTGLDDSKDMLHEANYGACQAARRDDLIGIGGADEHRDYLGYICGPYELTFRLVNAGCRERWLTDEFLYHTWHPGESSINFDYHGPSDDQGISSRATELQKSGRSDPAVENAAIRALRCNPRLDRRAALAMLESRADAKWKELGRMKADEAAPLLVKKAFLDLYDLYYYRDAWYGIPTCSEMFDPEKAKSGFYRECLRAKSRKHLKRWIERETGYQWSQRFRWGFLRWFGTNGPPSDFHPRPPNLIREAVCGYNIIHYCGTFFGVPQSLGPFDVSQAMLKSDCPYFRGRTISNVEKKIRMLVNLMPESVVSRIRTAVLRGIRLYVPAIAWKALCHLKRPARKKFPNAENPAVRRAA